MTDEDEKPIVFVSQVPNRRDTNTNALVPAVNISPASEHGEIRVMMPPMTSFFATGDLVKQLKDGLRDYNFERGDSIIALGDPAVIAVMGAILAGLTDSFYVLRWDRTITRYVKLKVRIR